VCVLAVRAVSEDLRMSLLLIAITLLLAEEEAGKNVHTLVQRVWTVGKVKCACVVWFNPLTPNDL
jgi:hypothetical protein